MSKTMEAQNTEAAVATILQLFHAEPSCRAALYQTLVICQTEQPSAEVLLKVGALPEMKTALQTPQALLARMVKAGGIEHLKKQDEPEESKTKKSSTFRTTKAGNEVIARQSPSRCLQALLSEDAKYCSVYELVLKTCEVPKTREEIEAVLKENPLLEQPKIYASYFLEGLDKNGGLEWDEKWQTTQAGKAFLN